MKTSVDVHNFLQSLEVPHEIFLLRSPVKTAKGAAVILGLKTSEILKSVLFLADEKPILVILPGDKKVSYKKLKKLLGASRIRLATTREVMNLTGYIIGATPPLAHQTSLLSLIDGDVMKCDVVYTGGGELNAMLKMRAEDLKQVTNGEVVDVADPLKETPRTFLES
ncbi:MAG: YbaK/EbsC family protein [Actinomycetota bacterium]|nr:YbaK/EbsC family protein [Actinomycetota bacterium]